MYSIKPGRGPSLMGGVAGIIVAAFGVIWTVVATSMGAPPLFALFGIVFVLATVAGAIYHFYNAGARNRISHFDITTDREESDPIADALGHTRPPRPSTSPRSTDADPRQIPGDFCPYCGEPAEPHYDFCPKCGKDI